MRLPLVLLALLLTTMAVPSAAAGAALEACACVETDACDGAVPVACACVGKGMIVVNVARDCGPFFAALQVLLVVGEGYEVRCPPGTVFVASVHSLQTHVCVVP